MSDPAIRISTLNKQEIEAADMLCYLYDALRKLGRRSRENVYFRWEQLHLVPDGDGKRWEREVQRITRGEP
jgi:hypothetical protein